MIDIVLNKARVDLRLTVRIVAALLGAALSFGCLEAPAKKAEDKLRILKPKQSDFAPAPPAEDPKYPRYDPHEKLYQGWPWWRHPVSAPPSKPIDWNEQHKIELSRLGFEFLKYGAIVAIFGIAFCMAVQNELADAFGAFVAAGGLLSVGFGMGFMWISEVWQWVVYGATVALSIWLAMRFRGRGLKMPCKTKPQKVQ